MSVRVIDFDEQEDSQRRFYQACYQDALIEVERMKRDGYNVEKVLFGVSIQDFQRGRALCDFMRRYGYPPPWLNPKETT